jgi:hypothetical protein
VGPPAELAPSGRRSPRPLPALRECAEPIATGVQDGRQATIARAGHLWLREAPEQAAPLLQAYLHGRAERVVATSADALAVAPH